MKRKKLRGAVTGEVVFVTYMPLAYQDFETTEVAGIKFSAYQPVAIPIRKAALALKLVANPWFCIGPLHEAGTIRKNEWMDSRKYSKDVTEKEAFIFATEDINLDRNFVQIAKRAERIKPRDLKKHRRLLRLP